MFTIQQVNSKKTYCICQDVWKHFKIVDIYSTFSSIEIYMTCHGGLKKKLLDIQQFHHIPIFLTLTKLEIEPREHVKIDVIGGNITLLGQSYAGAEEMNSRMKFSLNCPFINNKLSL